MIKSSEKSHKVVKRRPKAVKKVTKSDKLVQK